MSIAQARAYQQQQQVQAIDQQRSQPVAIVATNPIRDPVDGRYRLAGNDGSVIAASYISNSQIQQTPTVVVPSRTIGLPGYTTQRPR